MHSRYRRGLPTALGALALALAPAAAQQGGKAGKQSGQQESQQSGEQGGQRAGPSGAVPEQEIAPWSSERIARAAGLLLGSWRSEEPVSVQGEDQEAATVWLHVSRAPVEGLADAMYLELHRADDAVRPYRQALLQIYEHDGGLRLRTYEPTNLRDGLEAYAGFWKIPQHLPPLSRENAIATMDVPLELEEGRWRGETEHPYPTDRSGAVEMRTAIEAGPERLVVADRGYDASGEQVWGPGEGGTAFVRETYPLEVVERESGLILLDYSVDVSRHPEDGEMVRWAYDAWLWETGRQFAGSDIDGVLPEYQHPPPADQLNSAWGEAVRDAGLGTTRRIVTPPELAYGRSGWPARGVPPNAVLVFHMELVNIEAPPEEDRTPMGPSPDDGGGEGGEDGAAAAEDAAQDGR